ncbi:MAG: hypothetical protein M3Z75_28710, partial [Actinomycetota bacterium]|nr:hypothetical protein [Actinomycetota bacterium]
PLTTRDMLPGPGSPAATSPAATRPAATRPAAPAATATGAPGTVLRDCQSNNGGTLDANWKAESLQAGPVWFIYLRPVKTAPSRQRLVAGTLTASAMVIAVSNGRTAVVTAAPATRGRYRFLAAFNNDGSPYTLAEGAPGLKLAGCPAGPLGTGVPASYAAGLTMFWEGYVTDLRGCIPLEVSTSPARPPIRVIVPAPGGGCGS